jgi:hypothetical protein
MVSSNATTPDEYVAALPEDRADLPSFLRFHEQAHGSSRATRASSG